MGGKMKLYLPYMGNNVEGGKRWRIVLVKLDQSIGMR